MSDSAPLKVTLARVAGLVFVLIGCAALTSAYLGWREGPTQPAAPVASHSAQPAKSPRIVIKRTNRPARKTARIRTPAPNRRQPRIATALHGPAKSVAKAPPAPAPSSWRRTLAWSSCLLLLGLALVGYSLHERPKIIRSGADEMLNEPTPF